MSIRVIFILLILCTGCQFGKIPCPKTKEARLRKHFRTSSVSLSARANQEPDKELQRQNYKEGKDEKRFVKNVSMEDWDCPKPGEKKYMPKSVKDNIRRNMKKVKAGNVQSDSLSHR